MHRHDLAWLWPHTAGAARPAGGSCAPAHAARALLDDWIERGHPLIVTRQSPGSGAGIALGLALPPAWGKARLAFLVPRECVRETMPPPTLASARERLPQAWRPKLRALLASSEVAAASPRVYGSAAIEALTGEPCLGLTSDLDLLLSPPTWAAAVAVAAAVAAIDEAIAEPRLDGEIWNPEGVAVAWRELAARPQRVLAKGHTDVELVSLASFGTSFAPREPIAA